MKSAKFFEKGTVFSLEVFPPKRTNPVESISGALEAFSALAPDFISVTYGAAGSNNSGKTLEIVNTIRTKFGVEGVAHLACVNLSRERAREILGEMKALGIENVLALRGDIPAGAEPLGEFRHASDLVEFIKGESADFNVLAACYPEGHFECANLVEDIKNLRKKVDAGVDHLVSQLFFDNDFFYAFLERCELAGIDVPVEAGIMPVVNKKQIERMATLCRVKLPKKFVAMMERYEHNALAMRDAGIAYAVDQIVDLVSQGVRGIHLYTMNNPYIAQRIHEATASLIRCAC